MINLYTTYYREKNAIRKSELDLCLLVNNSLFDRVIVLAENAACPEWFLPTEGAWFVQETRPKLSEIFAAVTKFGSGDCINVITNGDILFTPQTIDLIKESIQRNQVYCLARYEITTMQLWDVDYAQDTWIFIDAPRVKDADYYLGVMGGDNKLCYAFHEAGYEVLNPSRDIKIYHVHASGVLTKMSRNEKFRLSRPYLRVTPTKLNEIPKYRA